MPLTPQLPKLPNPEKISFGGFRYVDYLAQVLPLTAEEMNAQPTIDSPEAMLNRFMWEVCTGKMSRVRFEAAESYISKMLEIPKHEATLQMEYAMHSRVDPLTGSGPKFVRLRIYRDQPESGVAFDIFGSRRVEIEKEIEKGIKITGKKGVY